MYCLTIGKAAMGKHSTQTYISLSFENEISSLRRRFFTPFFRCRTSNFSRGGKEFSGQTKELTLLSLFFDPLGEFLKENIAFVAYLKKEHG